MSWRILHPAGGPAPVDRESGMAVNHRIGIGIDVFAVIHGSVTVGRDPIGGAENSRAIRLEMPLVLVREHVAGVPPGGIQQLRVHRQGRNCRIGSNSSCIKVRSTWKLE